MIEFFRTILFQPLYNTLVFLDGVIPGGDVGLAIIALTLLVRVALIPVSHKSVVMQKKIREIDPEMRAIKDKHKDNREEQARQIMELYRRHGINPFGSIVLLFIQIPILIALYWVVQSLPFEEDFLYSFIKVPETTNFIFLGIVDLTVRSIPLAILVAISQYIQVRLAMPSIAAPKEDATMGDHFARSMQLNMRYVMPLFMGFIAATFPAAIALYLLTSNLFMIGHELFVKRKAKEIASQEIS